MEAMDSRRRHRFTRGERLRAAREHSRGLSQKEFAAVLGVARNTVNRYEADAEGADKPIVLMRWAEVTDFDYDWLVHGDSPPDGSPEQAGRASMWIPGTVHQLHPRVSETELPWAS